MTATEPRTEYKYVGTRPIRHDGLDKVTGRARFAADLTLPGQLTGVVVRSPHPHARILSIDTAAAEAMPGVKAVITGADFPEVNPGDPDYDLCANLMARGGVWYEGHAVAAVAAVTPEQARAGAAAVDVEYELLPPVLTIDEALDPKSHPIHTHMITSGADPAPTEPSNISEVTNLSDGDIEAGFADADVVVEREFTTKAVHQGYIEPHAVVADTAQDGKTTIWGSSQGHFKIRSESATMLGWDPSRIKVIPAEIGGGFGGKTTVYLEPLAALLSSRSGRPVKIVMGRDDVFRATGPAPGTKIRVKIGAKKDGTFVAGDSWMAYDTGAVRGAGSMLGAWCVFATYKIPNTRVDARDVVLNTPASKAYRAPSAPMAAYATESVIDELARELGMDPIELRLKNVTEEGALTLMGPLGPIGLVECLEAIRDSEHYSAPLGENQGRGIAAGYCVQYWRVVERHRQPERERYGHRDHW